jgi:hypothetical protein
MFYAIEYAYGRHTVNNGQRADRVLQFTRKRLRDAWVADGPAYDGQGARDAIGHRAPQVMRADWTDEGDSEGWQVIARQRVENSPKLQPYRDVLIDYDWCNGLDHPRWVATASEREILDWAQTVREQAAGV